MVVMKAMIEADEARINGCRRNTGKNFMFLYFLRLRAHNQRQSGTKKIAKMRTVKCQMPVDDKFAGTCGSSIGSRVSLLSDAGR
jgi:hypothetical protein